MSLASDNNSCATRCITVSRYILHTSVQGALLLASKKWTGACRQICRRGRMDLRGAFRRRRHHDWLTRLTNSQSLAQAECLRASRLRPVNSSDIMHKLRDKLFTPADDVMKDSAKDANPDRDAGVQRQDTYEASHKAKFARACDTASQTTLDEPSGERKYKVRPLSLHVIV
jgi:hypothetical protein